MKQLACVIEWQATHKDEICILHYLKCVVKKLQKISSLKLLNKTFYTIVLLCEKTM